MVLLISAITLALTGVMIYFEYMKWEDRQKAKEGKKDAA